MTTQAPDEELRRRAAATRRITARAYAALVHARNTGMGPPVGRAIVEDDGYQGEIPLWSKDIEELRRDDFAGDTITIVIDPN